MLFSTTARSSWLPASILRSRDLQANLQALPMFGVDDLYVSARSLRGVAWRRSAWPSRSRCSTTRPCATCCNATR